MGKQRRRRESWKVAAFVAVMIGVSVSVLLMSVAYGVSASITQRLDNPALRGGHLANVGEIDAILALLTAVVTSAMFSQTAAATWLPCRDDSIRVSLLSPGLLGSGRDIEGGPPCTRFS